MIENKAIATRESYGNALVEIAKEHDDLVVLDADRIVRQLQRPGSQLLYDLAHEFGSSVIKENGELARDVLGSIIFHDESAKYKLNDEKVLELAKADEKIAAAIAGKEIKKEIYVPGKLVNIVAV